MESNKEKEKEEGSEAGGAGSRKRKQPPEPARRARRKVKEARVETRQEGTKDNVQKEGSKGGKGQTTQETANGPVENDEKQSGGVVNKKEQEEKETGDASTISQLKEEFNAAKEAKKQAYELRIQELEDELVEEKRQYEELTKERDSLNKALKQANEISYKKRQELKQQEEETQKLRIQTSSLTAGLHQAKEANKQLIELVEVLAQGVADSLSGYEKKALPQVPREPQIEKKVQRFAKRKDPSAKIKAQQPRPIPLPQKSSMPAMPVQLCLSSSFSSTEREAIAALFAPTVLSISSFDPSRPVVSLAGQEKVCFVVWKCGTRVDEAVEASSRMLSDCKGNCVQILCVPEEEWGKWEGPARFELMQNDRFESGINGNGAGDDKIFLLLSYKVDDIKRTSVIKDPHGKCVTGIKGILQHCTYSVKQFM